MLKLMVSSLIACCLVLSVHADTIEGESGVVEITPLVHSSVQLEYNTMVIQVDPWNILGLGDAKPADLILITDNPGHHLDVSAVEKLRKPGAPVVIPANGSEQLPDAIVMANGETSTVAGVSIEAVATYDIIPGAPEHPKGDANGYVIEFGGRRFLFAGVTECVDEVKALQNIDVAFLPMNIPPGRMTPVAMAECAKILAPEVVYPYHYDQSYARRAQNPNATTNALLPDNLTVPQSLERLVQALAGSGIEVRYGGFYPPLD